MAGGEGEVARLSAGQPGEGEELPVSAPRAVGVEEPGVEGAFAVEEARVAAGELLSDVVRILVEEAAGSLEVEEGALRRRVRGSTW